MCKEKLEQVAEIVDDETANSKSTINLISDGGKDNPMMSLEEYNETVEGGSDKTRLSPKTKSTSDNKVTIL